MQKSARLTPEQLHRLGLTVVGNEAVRLADARPDPSWDEERLAVYAKGELANSQEAERQAILQAHKSAVHLFRAGHALALVREKCKADRHGAWGEFKQRYELADTTANDAIRLYERAMTEQALVGLGITQAKEKFGLAKPKKAKSATVPRKEPSPPGGVGSGVENAITHGGHGSGGTNDRGKSGHAGRQEPVQAENPPDADQQDEDVEPETAGETTLTLAEELEGIAQRLSEIALNEWGRVDWSVEGVGDVRLAVLAVNKSVATLIYKVNREAKKS